MLGYVFSKGHLVRYQRICQPGWPCPKFLCSVEGDKFPVVHTKTMLGRTVWVISAPGKGKCICGIAFAQGPRCTWWVMLEDGEVPCVPQRNLCENSQWIKLYDVCHYETVCTTSVCKSGNNSCVCITSQRTSRHQSWPQLFWGSQPDFPLIIALKKNELW